MSRILLLEDDTQIADALLTGLHRQGMMVEWLNNAREGRWALDAEQFDAVLLDLSLPEGDGMTLLAEWRARGFLSRLCGGKGQKAA